MTERWRRCTQVTAGSLSKVLFMTSTFRVLTALRSWGLAFAGADTSFTVPSLMPGTPTHVLVAALAEVMPALERRSDSYRPSALLRLLTDGAASS